jgi:hypothetical protein
MTRPTLRALAAAAIAVFPAATHAQAAAPRFVHASPRPLAAGDTVRLLSTAGRYAGTITHVSPDTLMVAAPGRLDAVVRADVTELYRVASREPRGWSIVRGAGVGLLAGAVLGLVGGTALGGTSPGEDTTATIAFTADGAFVGALLGAMIGPTFRQTRWERVDASPGHPRP